MSQMTARDGSLISGMVTRSVNVDVSSADQTIDPTYGGLYIGTGGDIVLRLTGMSTDTTYTNVPDGFQLNVVATAIRTSGTTASGIIAQY